MDFPCRLAKAQGPHPFGKPKLAREIAERRSLSHGDSPRSAPESVGGFACWFRGAEGSRDRLNAWLFLGETGPKRELGRRSVGLSLSKRVLKLEWLREVVVFPE